MISFIDTTMDPRRSLPARPQAPAAATEVVAEAREHRVLDAKGEPLAVGCAIEIGYFSRAQMATPFRGKWVPLSGRFSTASNQALAYPRIGDGSTPAGCFSWSHVFPQGVEALAPATVPLALRFYDHADPQSARYYTTVSNPSWWCRPPKEGRPALVFMSLDFDGTAWEGGPRDAFRTSLPVFGSMFSRLMALGGPADLDP